MKIEEVNIYDMPIWLCAVIDEISETCKKRLKECPEYRSLVNESDELLFRYPFISTLIDRDKIEKPMNLTKKEAKALSRFLALDADRENYERIWLYLVGCQHTVKGLQLLELL